MSLSGKPNMYIVFSSRTWQKTSSLVNFFQILWFWCFLKHSRGQSGEFKDRSHITLETKMREIGNFFYKTLTILFRPQCFRIMKLLPENEIHRYENKFKTRLLTVANFPSCCVVQYDYQSVQSSYTWKPSDYISTHVCWFVANRKTELDACCFER